MAMRIEWTEAALLGLRKIPANKAATLRKRIERVAAGEPLAKPMTGDLRGYHSVRLADFRALLRIENKVLLVTVVKVGPRKNVYE